MTTELTCCPTKLTTFIAAIITTTTLSLLQILSLKFRVVLVLHRSLQGSASTRCSHQVVTLGITNTA